MGQFKYTLPSGARFIMNAPTGTTQAQADFVFYSQVAAGSFVGYTAGQSLSTPATVTTEFELSRQDRDTAGVPNATVLAISTGVLVNPISPADVALTPKTGPVGPLSPDETQAANAQEANIIDQDPDVVDDGVGEYALQPYPLEKIGYLKPGTTNSQCGNLEHLLSTPSVWTGKNGVTALKDVTSNPVLQANMSTEIMQNSYLGLQAAGVIKDTTTQTPVTVTTSQVYTNNSTGGGLTTASVLTLLLGMSVVSGQFTGLIGSVANALSANNSSNVANLLPQPLGYNRSLSTGAIGTTVLGNLTAANANANVNGYIAGLVMNASQFGVPATAAWARGGNVLTKNILSGVPSPTPVPPILTGALTGSNTQAFAGGSASLGNVYSGLTPTTIGSLTPVAQTNLGTIPGYATVTAANVVAQMNTFGSMGKYSTAFSGLSTDGLVASTQPAPGYSDTVNRKTVDAAITRILGNDKIPPPEYATTGTAASTGLDIDQARAILAKLAGSAGQFIS